MDRLNALTVGVIVLGLACWALLIYRRGLSGFAFGLFTLAFVGVLRLGAELSFREWGESGAVIFTAVFFVAAYVLIRWARFRLSRSAQLEK